MSKSIKEEFKNFFADDGSGVSADAKPKNQDDREAAESDPKSLAGYMSSWNVRFNSADSGDKAKPHPDAELVWQTIANKIVGLYAVDRAGNAMPKGKGALSFDVGPPPLGQGKGGEPRLLPNKLDKFQKDNKKNIEAWFAAAYKWAVDEGKKATDWKKAIGTVPDTAKADKKVAEPNKGLNSFYIKGKFGVGGGVELPADVKPKSANQDYLTGCAPHKDADKNGTDGSGNNKVRKGAFGYVVGEVERRISVTETDETCTITDGDKKYEDVPVVKEDPAPIDTNDYLIDSPVYVNKLKEIPGYKEWRQAFPDFTELPFSGEEIKIDGKSIPADAGGPLYYPGKSSNGTIITGDKDYDGLLKSKPRPIVNDGKGEPIEDDSIGSVVMGEFPWNKGSVSDWVNNSDQPIIKTGLAKSVWGGTRTDKITASSKVLFLGNKALEDGPKNERGKAYSWSDPRSWGEYKEYTGDKKDTESEPSEEGGATPTLKYKFVFPSNFSLGSKNVATPEQSLYPESTVPGVPSYGSPGYPVMNKAYWGLRLAELYPGKTKEEIFKAATAPKDKSANAAVVPGTGGFRKAAVFVGGPAPPCNIVVSGGDFKFKWDKSIFEKKLSVKRTDGETFTRNESVTAPTWMKSKGVGTIGDNNYKYHTTLQKNIAKLMDNDKKVKWKASGGMIWVDPAKQIAPPYAPPPGLKPPMPNNKKETGNGVE